MSERVSYTSIIGVLVCLSLLPLAALRAAELNVKWNVVPLDGVTLTDGADGRVDAVYPPRGKSFPHFNLLPPQPLDLSRAKYLVMDLENPDPSKAIDIEVLVAGGDSPREARAGRASLRPGEKIIGARFELPHAGNRNFELKYPGMTAPPGFKSRHTVATDAVKYIRVNCPSSDGNRIIVGNIRTAGDYVPNPAFARPETFFPVIDRYGQFRHEEWPGKIKTDEDLKAVRRRGIEDRFYETSLRELAPDHDPARRKLPETLNELVRETETLLGLVRALNP